VAMAMAKVMRDGDGEGFSDTDAECQVPIARAESPTSWVLECGRSSGTAGARRQSSRLPVP